MDNQYLRTRWEARIKTLVFADVRFTADDASAADVLNRLRQGIG